MASSGNVLRGALSLSVGTGLTRALSAAGQLVLIIWLSPAEFGVWASAVASLSLLTSIVNFGEVNGYLSGRAPSFVRLVRSTRRLNAALALLGAAAIVLIWVFGGQRMGMLACVLVITIPVQGESDVDYALGIKQRRYRRLVVAQGAAAVVRLGLGVGMAAATGDAIALAVPNLVYYVVIVIMLRGLRRDLQDAPTPDARIGLRERGAWAANTLALSLPLQIGFFVAQFVTDDTTLGIYYLSFQLSLGISGLISVPLSRVALEAFGESSGRERAALGLDLSHALGAGVTAVVSIACFALVLGGAWVPSNWSQAVPVAILMLASLPARLMTPVVEAYQQARRQWWRSTTFNMIEALATAGIAATLSVVSLESFAILFTSWRLVFGVVRMWIVFDEAAIRSRLVLTTVLVAFTCALTLAGLADAWGFAVFAACAIGSFAWFRMAFGPLVCRRRKGEVAG